MEIYHLKISIDSYEDKLKASKSANAEQLTSFQEEIKGKEELIQELQSIIKGKILELFKSFCFINRTPLDRLSLKYPILARENELKELKEEHDGLEAASSDQVEVAAKFQKMALNMEEDIEAQKDEIQILHAAIEEHKEELTRQVAENDVLKEKEIILQNQIQKQTHDFKNQQTEFEVCFSQLKVLSENNTLILEA